MRQHLGSASQELLMLSLSSLLFLNLQWQDLLDFLILFNSLLMFRLAGCFSPSPLQFLVSRLLQGEDAWLLLLLFMLFRLKGTPMLTGLLNDPSDRQLIDIESSVLCLYASIFHCRHFNLSTRSGSIFMTRSRISITDSQQPSLMYIRALNFASFSYLHQLQMSSWEAKVLDFSVSSKHRLYSSFQYSSYASWILRSNSSMETSGQQVRMTICQRAISMYLILLSIVPLICNLHFSSFTKWKLVQSALAVFSKCPQQPSRILSRGTVASQGFLSLQTIKALQPQMNNILASYFSMGQMRVAWMMQFNQANPDRSSLQMRILPIQTLLMRLKSGIKLSFKESSSRVAASLQFPKAQCLIAWRSGCVNQLSRGRKSQSNRIRQLVLQTKQSFSPCLNLLRICFNLAICCCCLVLDFCLTYNSIQQNSNSASRASPATTFMQGVLMSACRIYEITREAYRKDPSCSLFLSRRHR